MNSNNNGILIIDELLNKYDNISPNILNLINDLSFQNYNFNIIPNDNLGIYKNNNKLIEFPLDCHQPGINDCLNWSGIKFANNQTNQDIIVDLYFNMLGFTNREYNNILKTNNEYKNIELTNVNFSYPLFKITGTDYFIDIIKESLKNIIYTDPGKLLMYRLFLASTEKQINTDIESINALLKDKFNLNELKVYKFPIIIYQSYNGAIHSIKYSRIGISLDPVDLFCEISDEGPNNIGSLSRTIETSLYHEFVHSFKQLLFIQLVKLNFKSDKNFMINMNHFEYKLKGRASVKQVFDSFCEYNGVYEPMTKQIIYDLICSILMYREDLDEITSFEEYSTIFGIYPDSKYYFPGYELSENLFRYYTNIPLRDAHFSIYEAYNPYTQSSEFLKNVKNKISNLNLNKNEICFHLPKKSGELANMTQSDIINFYNNQIKDIKERLNNNNINNNNDTAVQILGYKGCTYKLLDGELISGLCDTLDKIKFSPKTNFMIDDVNSLLD